MTALVRAPALPILAGIVVSLLLAARGAPPLVSAGTSLLAAGACLLWGGGKPPRGALPVTAAALALATLLGGWTAVRFASAQAEVPSGRIEGVGSVTMERPWGRGRACLIDLPGGRFLVFLSPFQAVGEGDRVRIRGRVGPFRSPRGGDGFDEGRYFRGRGARGRIEVESLRILPGGPSLAATRRFFRERILLNLPPLVRGNVLAAILGISDPDLSDDFRRWGISHLLAVSGGHVALVAAGVWWILRGRRGRYAATILCVWAYTLLSGAPGSALRAAVLATVLLAGRALGRPGTAFNATAAAAAAILAIRPHLLWDLGFQLSVLCVLTLAALPDSVPPRWILPAGQGATWLVSSGLCVSVFGSVPLAGLIANFLAIPLFTLLLPATLFFALPALILGPRGLAWTLALVPEALWELFGGAMDLVARFLPGSAVASAPLILSGTGLFLILCGRGMGQSWGSALAFSGAGGLLWMLLA